MSAATSYLLIHTLNLISCLPPQCEAEGNKTRLMAGSWAILLNPEHKWVFFPLLTLFLFSMCSMLSSWTSVTQHRFDTETDFMGKVWYDSTGELTNSQRVNCSHSLRWQWDAGCSTSLNKTVQLVLIRNIHGSEPRVRCGSGFKKYVGMIFPHPLFKFPWLYFLSHLIKVHLFRLGPCV